MVSHANSIRIVLCKIVTPKLFQEPSQKTHSQPSIKVIYSPKLNNLIYSKRLHSHDKRIHEGLSPFLIFGSRRSTLIGGLLCFSERERVFPFNARFLSIPHRVLYDVRITISLWALLNGSIILPCQRQGP